MTYQFVRVLIFLTLLIYCYGEIKVNPQTQFMVDEYGRTRIFHGLNAVYKIAPWIPQTDGFDPQLSLSEIDAANLQEWGFNSMRLGVMWSGIEAVKGQYNATLVQQFQELIEMLSNYGIYSIVDMHQDVYNRKFCGEGLPDWAAEPSELTLPFALPMAPEIKADPQTGYPPLSKCLERNFADYYFSHKVANCFQNLYENVNNVQEDFIAYWDYISAAFNSTKGVLGYELINEPWAGDFIWDPSVMIPGTSDRQNLFPMYQLLHSAIRQNDNERIIFFEKALVDIIGPNGFSEGPGGPAYNDRQSFSYHVYCGPTDREGNPSNIYECDFVDEFFFDSDMEDIKRIGCGSFMTEFGAVPNTNVSREAVRYLTNVADKNLQSWTYWQFKLFNDITTAGDAESLYDKDGNLEISKLKELSRTYAQAIQGVPTKMHFDADTSDFQLEFVVAPNVSAPTIIYLNEKLYYPNGFTVTLNPVGVAEWNQKTANYIELSLTNEAVDQTVSVSITAN